MGADPGGGAGGSGQEPLRGIACASTPSATPPAPSKTSSPSSSPSPFTDAVLAVATRALERHPLRAMDALHVACALVWEAERFVSADHRQVEAAGRAGLVTIHV